MKVLFVLSLALVLTACTTRTVYRTQTVKVEVFKPCIEEIPKQPAYETQSLTDESDIDSVATAYLVERQQRKRHIVTLEDLMIGCIDPKGEKSGR